MSAPGNTQEQEDRRRRPLLLWLGALVAVLLLLAGALALRAGDEGASAVRRPRLLPTALPPVVVDEPVPVSDGTVAGTATDDALTAAALGLRVEGHVRGLVAPGSPARLVLTVENTLSEDVVLTRAGASVTSTSREGCRVQWYRVAGFTGERSLPRRARTTLELPVSFLSDPEVNQDACKGARYAFTVDVRGRQA